MKKTALNRRALIALVMVYSFVLLPILGIALHFSDNASFQPVRHLLMTVHNLVSIIFLVATALHLNLNKKPLLSYVKKKAGQASLIRTEIKLAALIVASPLILGIIHVFALGHR